jgi:hypothetical protein
VTTTSHRLKSAENASLKCFIHIQCLVFHPALIKAHCKSSFDLEMNRKAKQQIRQCNAGAVQCHVL